MIGKIYKIIHNQSDICYVGSTCNELRQRWQEHKRHYAQKKKRQISICKYFDLYGIDNFKIILIKQYEVVDRTHLQAYEQLWINKLNNINRQNLLFPKFIRLENMRKRNKSGIYNDKNNARSRINYQKNKEKFSEKAKNYYQKNKEKLTHKVNCFCGGKYTMINKLQHFKTKRHNQ